VPKSQKHYQQLSKALLITLIGLILAGLLVYIFRFQILTGLATVLIVDDELQPADIIFVLSGDVDSRPFYAADLFKQGLAPQIMMFQAADSPAVELGLFPNRTDVAIEILKELGVPAENIKQLAFGGGATSTRDEARFLGRYVEEHNVTRVILVTNAFHTRRAKWIFDKELSGSGVTVEIAAAPHWNFDETNWWQQEYGLLAFVDEYSKLFYYYAVY